MDIFRLIRQKKTLYLLAQLIMGSFYRKLGQKLGVEPGAEMLEAIHLARNTGAQLVLADRDVQITLKRIWGYLGLFQKLKLAVHLAAGIFSTEQIDAELIEKIKQKDQLEAVLEEFTRKFPQIRRRLIDERDIYLSQKIRHAPGQKIVAVVGAGHIPGIVSHIHTDIPIDELTQLPPRSLWPTLIKWTIPLLILALVVWGFFKQGPEHSLQSLYIWVLVNGSLSAAGAACALAHPLTIAAAFVAAPLTSLNPMLGAGWVAALVQALVRRPKVAHFQSLPEDTSTVKGFWKNPVTRILLVAAFANLGSAIGTFIAGTWLATRTF